MTELLYERRCLGDDVSPWRLMQFEGMKAGPVGYGFSDEMSIVRLSREVAAQHWRKVMSLATNCSRLDLQTTIGPVADIPAAIADHEVEALDHVKDWLRQPEVTLRKSNRTGLTLYFNRRVSDRFARVYDKGVESRDPGWSKCMRYEVQFNGKAAKLMSNTLQTEEDEPGGVSGRVHAFFEARGCRLSWSPKAIRFNESVPRSQTDASRRLRWMKYQVQPCVQRLIDDGLLEQVLEALGLSELRSQRMDQDNQTEE